MIGLELSDFEKVVRCAQGSRGNTVYFPQDTKFILESARGTNLALYEYIRYLRLQARLHTETWKGTVGICHRLIT